MPTYRVVFDLAQSSYDGSFAATGLVFTALGVTMWLGANRGFPVGTRPSWNSFRLFPGALAAFGAFWALAVFAGTHRGYVEVRSALEEGRAGVVEGPVEHFHPMPKGGHGKESFDVQGARFEYSDYVVTPGFRHASTTGGPLREGLRVRIHHVRDLIVKLEVADGVDVADISPAQVEPSGPFPIVLFILVAFPALGLLLSLLSGWRSLADRFATQELPAGVAFPAQSLSMGGFGSYRGCVNVTVGPDSFGIVPVYPFGVGHPPLTIPFVAVDACETRSRLFGKHTVVTLRNGGGTIGIGGAAGPALRDRLADAPTTRSLTTR